jgi:hypothetical protein
MIVPLAAHLALAIHARSACKVCSRRRTGSRSPRCAISIILFATSVVKGSDRSISFNSRSVSSNADAMTAISSGPMLLKKSLVVIGES